MQNHTVIHKIIQVQKDLLLGKTYTYSKPKGLSPPHKRGSKSAMTLDTDLHYIAGAATASIFTNLWTEVLSQKFIMLQGLVHNGNLDKINTVKFYKFVTTLSLILSLHFTFVSSS